MGTRKGFTYNAPGDPPPWGAVENQLDFDLIDTLVLDCVSAAKDATNGHRHYRVWSTDGSVAALLAGNAAGDLTAAESLQFGDEKEARFGASIDGTIRHGVDDQALRFLASAGGNKGFEFLVDPGASPLDNIGMLLANKGSSQGSAALIMGWQGTKIDVSADQVLATLGLAHAGTAYNAYSAGKSQAYIEGVAAGDWNSGDYGSLIRAAVTKQGTATPYVTLQIDDTGLVRITDTVYNKDITSGYAYLGQSLYGHLDIGVDGGSAAVVLTNGVVTATESGAGKGIVGGAEIANDGTVTFRNIAPLYYVHQQPTGLFLITSDSSTKAAYGLMHFDATLGITKISGGADLTTTATNAGTVNVYDAGSDLEIENKTGGTIKVLIWLLQTD